MCLVWPRSILNLQDPKLSLAADNLNVGKITSWWWMPFPKSLTLQWNGQLMSRKLLRWVNTIYSCLIKTSNCLKEERELSYGNISLVSAGTLSILAAEYESTMSQEGYTAQNLRASSNLCFAINFYTGKYMFFLKFIKQLDTELRLIHPTFCTE